MIKSTAMKWAAGVSFLSAFLMAGVASATATYDIAPVTTSVTSELTANLPIILGVIGALLALGLAVKAVRKFVKV